MAEHCTIIVRLKALEAKARAMGEYGIAIEARKRIEHQGIYRGELETFYVHAMYDLLEAAERR